MSFRLSSSLLPSLLAAVLLALGGGAGAQGVPAEKAAADVAAENAMNRIVRRMASDENLGLFFDLLRRSIAAAAEGKPPPQLSAEERMRLEAGSKELQRDAVAASMRMLDQVEREMRESIRNERIGK